MLPLIYATLLLIVTIRGEELRCSISENEVPNSDVCSVAVLNDARLGEATYQLIVFDPDTSNFRINDDGMVVTTRVLDREELCPLIEICLLTQKFAIVQGSTRRLHEIIVNVLDKNDNRPEWVDREIKLNISESATVGSVHSILAAQDRDGLRNKVASYSLEPPTEMFVVEKDNEDANLIVRRPLDRESVARYRFTLLAHDAGIPSKSGSVLLTINLVDTNDNAPAFAQKTHNITVKETAQIGAPILQFQVRDADEGANAYLTFLVEPRRYSDVFGVTSDAILFLMQPLNYEVQRDYQIRVKAFDGGNPPKSDYTTVNIVVENMNDNPPVIRIAPADPMTSELWVDENVNQSQMVAYVLVTDPDTDRLEATCELDDPTETFKLQRLSGSEFELLTVPDKQIDREKNDAIIFRVTCMDFSVGQTVLSSNVVVTVFVRDENDNAPMFASKQKSVKMYEDNQPGQLVANMSAEDADTGQNSLLTYSLGKEAEGLFTVEEYTGVVRAERRLDREEQDLYMIRIYATDNGLVPKTASSTIKISVLDVNDNAPQFNQTVYHMSALEETDGNIFVGSVFAFDRDLGKNGEIRLSLDEHFEYEHFTVTQDGRIFTIRKLDREKEDRYHLRVVGTDSGRPPLSNVVDVFVAVNDTNDHMPEVSFPNKYNDTVYMAYNAPKGHVITRIVARDGDAGENAKLTYRIAYGMVSEWFDVLPMTGLVVLREPMNLDMMGTYPLAIEVLDGGEPPFRRLVNLTISVTQPRGLADFRSKDTLGEAESLIIIIILTSVSALVSIVIIVVILIVRSRECSRRQQMYRAAGGAGDDAADSAYSVKNPPEKKLNLMIGIERPSVEPPDHQQYSDYREMQPDGATRDPTYTDKKMLRALMETPGASPGAGGGSSTMGHNEDDSVCDSGRGASDEDLRVAKDNLYNTVLARAGQGYQNRDMSTFTPKLRKPSVTFAEEVYTDDGTHNTDSIRSNKVVTFDDGVIMNGVLRQSPSDTSLHNEPPNDIYETLQRRQNGYTSTDSSDRTPTGGDSPETVESSQSSSSGGSSAVYGQYRGLPSRTLDTIGEQESAYLDEYQQHHASDYNPMSENLHQTRAQQIVHPMPQQPPADELTNREVWQRSPNLSFQSFRGTSESANSSRSSTPTNSYRRPLSRKPQPNGSTPREETVV